MISKSQIDEVLSGFDKNKIKIATICSHSALQIFHGAKKEGFKTIGICNESRKETYDSFPLAKPDEYFIVKNFKDVLEKKLQDRLIENNVIIIPHGSFVEYVGPENLEERFLVPMFGNRKTLKWEGERKMQREWLEKADLRLPKQYKTVSEAGGKVFVKLSGAKGGRGFFTTDSEEDLKKKLKEKVKKGIISEADSSNITIQEFVLGVRYYVHYFYSPLENRTEMLSMDKRIEPIDESYRGLPNIPDEFLDYTVTGNQPIIIRESLLPEVIKMGINTVNASLKLFYPGMIGPFCLETIYHPENGFTVFEVSARIVAGTNLYPDGSPYSTYLFEEPMSTGRRIAREIKIGIKRNEIEKIIF
jgi:5-formaminoimidazole-4-carboxamide-1-(beta)-D-ribofuranosyl 5'-monophosphate synthetase